MTRPTYLVERIAAPVFGLRGALCGVPTVEITLGPTGRPLPLDGIVDEVQQLYAKPGAGVLPRWVWIRGTPSPDAHDLVVGCQVLLKRSVYTEADACKPMSDIGKLPLYDHVAAVVRPPVKALRVELFHSLMAHLPGRPEDLDTLNRFLEQREYNGHRFLLVPPACTPEHLAVLLPHARLWRLSPVAPATPPPRLSPLFSRRRLQPRRP